MERTAVERLIRATGHHLWCAVKDGPACDCGQVADLTEARAEVLRVLRAAR